MSAIYWRGGSAINPFPLLTSEPFPRPEPAAHRRADTAEVGTE